MKHHSLQTYDYHVWANQRIFGHIKELPPHIYNQEIGNVDSSISKMLLHIYQTDALWLSVMSGDSFNETMDVVKRLMAETTAKKNEEIEMVFSHLSKRYKAFLDRQEDLDKAISCEHPHFGRLETRLSELVQHVVNHGTYHRGNITTMLRELGHPGTSTDYIFYLYEMNKE
ncbi:DinB family protein [Aneurinibacillus tyrosinisolvens]|uniref:DinB family protein n=1 Tax=Aneurinibacillus tyrosinisolvens TaxID=1443435 RepID=UPI00063FBC86|nr:DinB family protein [Aneurinibacillus tyrosinisolvens]